MLPLYVSFYTIGTPYEQEAAALRETLDAFGLPHDVRGVPSCGSWVRNCARKAGFIRDMIAANPGRPIVWLDADARVVCRPDLLESLDCDFAAHWLGGQELLSGTTFWGGTAGALALAETWAGMADRMPDEWDQRTLQAAVTLCADISVRQLPPEYTWICAVDGTQDVSEFHYGQRDPVIVHRQASRRLRNAS